MLINHTAVYLLVDVVVDEISYHGSKFWTKTTKSSVQKLFSNSNGFCNSDADEEMRKRRRRNLQGCISLGPRALRFFFCHHEIYPIPEKQTFRLNINAVMPLRYLPLLTSLN